MRVISKARLVDFWQEHAIAKAPLTHWYNHVSKKTTIWASFADVRKDYSSADKVGDCYIFDIGGNSFRLIVKIIRECVYIRKIMTHAEYDEQKWIVECKCLEKLKKDQPKTAKQSRKKSAKKVRRKR
ncbi:MAG: type II toxin-antitoxin system HigB family toxin [Planctomycetota bacterium]|nr:type II toxin-antitoxin system HigB family toxin [Planctomycetota bacterium]